MNKTVVTSGVELSSIIRKLLLESTLPSFSIIDNRFSDLFDLCVTASASGKRIEFVVECKLCPTVHDVEHLSRFQSPLPLLATVKLTPSIVEECKKRGVSCLDLNGRVWISAKGLVVDRDLPPRRTRYVLPEAPVSFFSLKSSRLARTLLSAPDCTWKQADLVKLTQLSKGLVSRLLNYARQQGWVEGRRGGWRLVNFDGLLDTWEGEDSFSKRVVLRQYSTLEPERRTIARQLIEKAQGNTVFTQWFAASLRFPYADVNVVTAYRRRLLTDEEERALNYRQVDEGGKVWIAIPRDDGVFLNTTQVEGFSLVSDAQIYLDLIHAGLRGPDQAKALREWKGFCRT